MRKLASLRRISDIRPIDNADFIEVCVVDGWEVVTKKGQFNIGDLIVYIEIDSKVPETDEFEFLRDRGFKVKTIKLRKQVSQGLIMPTSILPLSTYVEGCDLTDVLGITKIETKSDIEANKVSIQKTSKWFRKMMRFGWFRKIIGDRHLAKLSKKSLFPDWIKKTNEERVQNMPQLYKKMHDEYDMFTVTEKIDGQPATYGLKKGFFLDEFVVCSRNIRRPHNDNSSFWQVNNQHGMMAVLKDIAEQLCERSVVLQGEIIGQGIQSNKYNKVGYEFYAFNLIIDGHKVNYLTMESILDRYGIKCVPLIDDKFLLPGTIKDIVDYSTKKSLINKSINQEGIVVRGKDVSFKVINPDFLLKECKND